MKKLFVVVCEDLKTEYMCVENETLYFSPLYEHVYGKIGNALRALGIREFEVVKCAAYDIKDNSDISTEIDAELEDVVVFAHPLSFLVDGREIEKALSFVIENDLSYATVGSPSSLCMTIGTGKMITDDFMETPYDFIEAIKNCGATCQHKAFAEENALPKSRLEYTKMCQVYREELFDYHTSFGVIIELRDSIIISPDSKIGAGTRILPNSQICAGSEVGSGCLIGPSSIISSSVVGDDTVIDSSQIYASTIEKDVSIGPFCHVCDGAHILSDTEIYGYVDVRNSLVGPLATVREHSLIADSEVGARVQIGASFLVATYDGRKHNRSKVCDDAFIGANVTLVSPINVGLGAYIAAGSTITDDVPAGALAIARDYQTNHDGWAARRRRKSKLH